MPQFPPPEQSNTHIFAGVTLPRLWTYIVLGLLLSLCLLAVVLFVYSAPGFMKKEKIYRVGILNALDFFSPAIDGFKKGMTDLGYVEGENIIYDVQKASQPVGNQAIAERFVNEKVDLIFVFPTEAALEAKEATKDTNIPVIAVAFSVNGNDLVQSIQRPGGNVTGVRMATIDIAVERFEIMRKIMPEAKRFWIPYLKDYPTVASALGALRPRAQELGITLLETPFTTPDELKEFLESREKKPDIDAILYIPEPLTTIPMFSDQISDFADRHEIPISGIGIAGPDSANGPLFIYLPDAFNMGEIAAPIAQKVFDGEKPGNIPIVTPDSILTINHKAFERLNLDPSDALLNIADKIVH